MSLRFGTGSVSFSLDEAGEALVRQWIDTTFPGVIDRVTQATEAVHWQAVGRSPVKTGRFRASFQREVQVAPDLSRVRGRCFNESEYGRFVKSPKLPGTGSAFVELLRKPMEIEGRAVVEDLRSLIERTMGDR